MSTLALINNRDTFAHAWNVAKVFASSQLIPEHLRGKQEDVFLALAMAEEMKENPIIVMQSIYVVSGKAGWSTQYIIARANRSGVFKGRINWKIERRTKNLDFNRKKKTGWNSEARKPIYTEIKASMPDMTVTAYATLAETGEEISFAVDSAMAIAEGWADNEKYSTLGELMLRYRSAALLVRLYAPDVMLGYQTVDELEIEPGVSVIQPKVAPPGLAARTSPLAITEGQPPVDLVAEAARLAERDRVRAEGVGDEESGEPSDKEKARIIAEEQAQAAAEEAERRNTSSTSKSPAAPPNGRGKPPPRDEDEP